MNTLDLAWVSFRKAWYDNEDYRGDPEYEEAHRRGEDEAHQNWLNTSGDDGLESFMDEEPEEPQRPKRPPHGLVGPARTLGPEQILRLSRAQMNELMENIQNEIQRREAKKASKNVGVKGSRR